MTPGRKNRGLAATFLVVTMWVPNHAAWARDAAENLVLVTLDGVRWQEVFAGVDMSLLNDERYTHKPEAMKETYWHELRSERRRRLFPFLWSVVASEGVLIGDRTRESYMEVSNGWWFSYPGYNEILTGQADDRIDSNAKIWNPNITFLEILNGMRRYKNRVLAFGSWDVYPYIINTERSGLPVNAGFNIAATVRSKKARWLNELSAEAPRLWTTVRVDFLTNGYAMQALKNQHPRVVYIAYGETDDFAHDGSYDRYLDAAHRNDHMLSKLWSWLQNDRFYRDRTTLIISTDHGRGNTPDGWPHHASPAATAKRGVTEAPEGVPGSDQIWLAAIGPRIQSHGLVKGHWKQSQIAATALASLRLDPVRLMPEAAPAMDALLRSDGR
ncbi:MAG: phosphoglyceromutase [Gammaproteobacteria bacterium]|nr:phosphoglyceromutase [Gammaproteobacteria bacterium]